MSSDLADLRRRYQPVTLAKEVDADTSYALWLGLDGKEPGEPIEDLAQEPLTVILGEARSGKTTELKLAAERNAAAGQNWFFLRIEDLVAAESQGDAAIALAIDAARESAFIDWKNGKTDAVFLLDAVDEAKIQRASDYRRAVRKFQTALGKEFHRIRMILSCRVSEWRPRDDLEPLKALLPHLARPTKIDPSKAEPTVALVQIIPLDEERLKILAQHRGIPGVGKFIQAIKEADATDFAGRPADAIELMEIWQRQGRLGTLTELVSENIDRKLVEDAAAYLGSPTISADRARKGAERLAAAAILCGTSNFRVVCVVRSFGTDGAVI